jgi:hypothetical protein
MNLFNLDANRISVVHNALDERFSAEKNGTDEAVLERAHDPFILYSGRIVLTRTSPSY